MELYWTITSILLVSAMAAILGLAMKLSKVTEESERQKAKAESDAAEMRKNLNAMVKLADEQLKALEEAKTCATNLYAEMEAQEKEIQEKCDKINEAERLISLVDTKLLSFRGNAQSVLDAKEAVKKHLRDREES